MLSPTSLPRHAGFVLTGVSALLLFARCTADESECRSSQDCSTGEICIEAGGVFVQGGRCRPVGGFVDSEMDAEPTTDGDGGGRDADAADAPPRLDADVSGADGCGPERCNGRDDDCDGEVDEPRECPKTEGICSGTTVSCTNDGYQSCEAQYGPNYEADESSADDLDNDCDGVVDEVYTAVDISGTSKITCGLTAEGAVDCEITDSNISSDFSVQFPIRGNFTQVAAGYQHVCALKSNGRAECWGEGPNSSSGVDDPPPTTFEAIDSGEGVSCGIEKSTGEVECWGIDPKEPTDEAVDLAVEVSRCIVNQEGQAACWGPRTPTEVVEDVPNASNRAFDAIEVSEAHACARIQSSRELRCWGKDNTPNAPEPVDAFDLGSRATASEGTLSDNLYGCGLRPSDGSIFRWGATKPGRNLPDAEQGYVDIAVGDTDGCAVRADGAIECWGPVTPP